MTEVEATLNSQVLRTKIFNDACAFKPFVACRPTHIETESCFTNSRSISKDRYILPKI